MNIKNRFLVALSAITFVLGLTGPIAVFAAATDPGLVAAASFSVIAQTNITGVATISGDVGLNSTGAGITALTTDNVAGTIYATDLVAPSEAIFSAATVQANLSTVWTNTIPDMGTDGSIGPALDALVVTPGVYDIGAGRLNGGILHLNGPGIYIFRASSDFISSGSIDLQNGARACDVYWRVDTLATINGASFIGTILAGTGVHFDTAGTTLNGRALAKGGNVTFVNNVISGPTCAAAVGSPLRLPAGATASFLPNAGEGTITVVKTVIGATGGTLADFPLFVSGTPMVSGQYKFFPAPATYTVTEAPNSNYNAVFSGDCDPTGHVTLNPGESKFCLITNARVLLAPVLPPLIDVVKVPSPLALPNGPGLVTYTYTVRNVGPVRMSNVSLVGDTCSPIKLVSGDTNNDSILNRTETWIFRCATMISANHTNTVVATGWANGISATDIATAHVIVGLPIVPPLIHVTKTPSPLALPAGGGWVTYTKKVTNPGTVALSNVRLTDDKCSPVKFISGDTNGDSKLDPSETWTYTCRARLTKTTLNTAIAEGTANNITVRDFALATVVVPLPKLPNTGFAPVFHRK